MSGPQCLYPSLETERLEVRGGNWVEVKTQITVKDARTISMAAGGVLWEEDGVTKMKLDPVGGRVARLSAWIVAWSLRDREDRPVPFSKAALEALEIDALNAIDQVVDRHILAMEAQREKNASAGGTIAPTSISPSVG